MRAQISRPSVPKAQFTPANSPLAELSQSIFSSFWSIPNLAKAMGVSRVILHNWLHGHKPMPAPRLRQLADLIRGHPLPHMNSLATRLFLEADKRDSSLKNSGNLTKKWAEKAAGKGLGPLPNKGALPVKF